MVRNLKVRIRLLAATKRAQKGLIQLKNAGRCALHYGHKHLLSDYTMFSNRIGDLKIARGQKKGTHLCCYAA